MKSNNGQRDQTHREDLNTTQIVPLIPRMEDNSVTSDGLVATMPNTRQNADIDKQIMEQYHPLQEDSNIELMDTSKFVHSDKKQKESDSEMISSEEENYGQHETSKGVTGVDADSILVSEQPAKTFVDEVVKIMQQNEEFKIPTEKFEHNVEKMVDLERYLDNQSNERQGMLQAQNCLCRFIDTILTSLSYKHSQKSEKNVKARYFNQYGPDVTRRLCTAYNQLQLFAKKPQMKTFMKAAHLICHKGKYVHIVQKYQKRKLSIGFDFPSDMDKHEYPVVDCSGATDIEIYLNYADFFIDDSSVYYFEISQTAKNRFGLLANKLAKQKSTPSKTSRKLSIRSSDANDKNDDQQAFVYTVTLKKFDLNERELTDVGKTSLETMSQLLSIQFFNKQGQSDSLLDMFVCLVSKDTIKMRRLQANEPDLGLNKDIMQSSVGCKNLHDIFTIQIDNITPFLNDQQNTGRKHAQYLVLFNDKLNLYGVKQTANAGDTMLEKINVIGETDLEEIQSAMKDLLQSNCSVYVQDSPHSEMKQRMFMTKKICQSFSHLASPLAECSYSALVDLKHQSMTLLVTLLNGEAESVMVEMPFNDVKKKTRRYQEKMGYLNEISEWSGAVVSRNIHNMYISADFCNAQVMGMEWNCEPEEMKQLIGNLIVVNDSEIGNSKEVEDDKERALNIFKSLKSRSDLLKKFKNGIHKFIDDKKDVLVVRQWHMKSELHFFDGQDLTQIPQWFTPESFDKPSEAIFSVKTPTLTFINDQMPVHPLLIEFHEDNEIYFSCFKNKEYLVKTQLCLSKGNSKPLSSSLCQSAETQEIILKSNDGLVNSYESTRYSAVTMTRENICEFTVQLIDVKISSDDQTVGTRGSQLFKGVASVFGKKKAGNIIPISKSQSNSNKIDPQNSDDLYVTAHVAGKQTILLGVKPIDTCYLCQIYPYFEEISKGSNKYIKIVGSRTVIHTSDQVNSQNPQVILRNEIDESTETKGAFTAQNVQMLTYDMVKPNQHESLVQFICATVVLRDDLLKLRGTEYDHFEVPGAIDPVCLFDLQTKNILNTLHDDYTTILDPKFDRNNQVLFLPCKLNQPRFILGGKSIVNMRIQEHNWQKYRDCLGQIQKTTTSSLLSLVRDPVNATNQTPLQHFIHAVDQYHKLNPQHHLKPEKFVKYLQERQLIVVESDFLYYDVNCQSQLLALFFLCKGNDKSGPAVPHSEAMKPFVDMLKFIRDQRNTKINQEQVREHMTSLLQVTGYHYQLELNDRHLFFEQILRFFGGAPVTQSDIMKSAELQRASLTQLIELKNSLLPIGFSSELFQSRMVIDDAKPTQYMQDALTPISQFFESSWNQLKKEYFSTDAEKQVEYMMVDLRPLVKQRKIMKMINAKNVHFQDPDDQEDHRLFFNRKEFAKMMKGMMRQAEWGNSDENETKIIMNMIKAHYQDTSRSGVTFSAIIFFFGHMLPTILQMLVQNRHPTEGDWRMNGKAYFIYACLLVSTITQAVTLQSEVQSLRRAPSYGEFFQTQNILDMISILFTFVYNGLRVVCPGPTKLDVSNLEGPGGLDNGLPYHMSQLYDCFPLIHVFHLTFCVGQALFYIQLSESLTKFKRLFIQSLNDSWAFIFLYLMIIIYFSMTFHLLGAKFDDGGNYDDAYDTNFNDYPNIENGLVTFMSVLRTSIGDLMPPSYDYWDMHYDSGQNHRANGYTIAIWVNFFICVVITVILALNFLIAIVSQSYESVMSDQDRAINESVMEMNWENTLENEVKTEEDIDFVIMIIESRDSEGDQWMGLTRSINKNFENMLHVLQKENTTVQELKVSMEGVKHELFQKIEDEQQKVDCKFEELQAQPLKDLQNLVKKIDAKQNRQIEEIQEVREEIKQIKLKNLWHNVGDEGKKNLFKYKSDDDDIVASSRGKRPRTRGDMFNPMEFDAPIYTHMKKFPEGSLQQRLNKTQNTLMQLQKQQRSPTRSQRTVYK